MKKAEPTLRIENYSNLFCYSCHFHNQYKYIWIICSFTERMKEGENHRHWQYNAMPIYRRIVDGPTDEQKVCDTMELEYILVHSSENNCDNQNRICKIFNNSNFESTHNAHKIVLLFHLNFFFILLKAFCIQCRMLLLVVVQSLLLILLFFQYPNNLCQIKWCSTNRMDQKWIDQTFRM